MTRTSVVIEAGVKCGGDQDTHQPHLPLLTLKPSGLQQMLAATDDSFPPYILHLMPIEKYTRSTHALDTVGNLHPRSQVTRHAFAAPNSLCVLNNNYIFIIIFVPVSASDVASATTNEP